MVKVFFKVLEISDQNLNTDFLQNCLDIYQKRFNSDYSLIEFIWLIYFKFIAICYRVSASRAAPVLLSVHSEKAKYCIWGGEKQIMSCYILN